MGDSDMMAFFLEDVLDMLQTWEEQCLSLEKDSVNPDFNELFRIAHNIKGSSKMVDLGAFGDFIHKVEDVIELLRKDQLEFETSHIDFFLDVHTYVETWLEELSRDKTFLPDGHDEFLIRINKIIETASGGAKKVPVESQEPKRKIEINSDNDSDIDSDISEQQLQTGASLMEVQISKDLVIANLGEIIDETKFESGKDYSLIIDSTIIDTAGAQYLVSLRKTKDFNIQIRIIVQEILDTLDLLGLEGMIL